MTEEEIQAIETMKHWIEYEKENKNQINKAEELIQIQETILNLINKQQTAMYAMASFIASQDIEADICENTGRLGECDSMAYGECENCIISYFKNNGKNI